MLSPAGLEQSCREVRMILHLRVQGLQEGSGTGPEFLHGGIVPAALLHPVRDDHGSDLKFNAAPVHGGPPRVVDHGHRKACAGGQCGLLAGPPSAVLGASGAAGLLALGQFRGRGHLGQVKRLPDGVLEVLDLERLQDHLHGIGGESALGHAPIGGRRADDDWNVLVGGLMRSFWRRAHPCSSVGQA